MTKLPKMIIMRLTQQEAENKRGGGGEIIKLGAVTAAHDKVMIIWW